jgi:hypothetical protein
MVEIERPELARDGHRIIGGPIDGVIRSFLTRANPLAGANMIFWNPVCETAAIHPPLESATRHTLADQPLVSDDRLRMVVLFGKGWGRQRCERGDGVHKMRLIPVATSCSG